jgi:hypothetical protein
LSGHEYVSRHKAGLDLAHDCAALLRVDPSMSANEVYRRLRAAGKHVWKNDVFYAVRTLRSFEGVPKSVRYPGRPRKIGRGSGATAGESASGADGARLGAASSAPERNAAHARVRTDP